MESNEPKVSPNVGDIVKFHYIKGNFYRAIHVDGAYGGLTPRGTIALSCFNERRPLPVQTGNKLVHGRDENLTLGPETDDALISKDGIIREIDATLYVTVEVARDIAYWLLNQVSQFEHIQNALTTSNQAGDK